MTTLNSGSNSNGNGSYSLNGASGFRGIADDRPLQRIATDLGATRQEGSIRRQATHELTLDGNGRWVKSPKRGHAPTQTPMRRPGGQRPAAAGTVGQPGTAMALVRFLETSSCTQDLVLVAGQHLFHQSTTPQQQSHWLKKAVGATGIWTFGEDLHGKQAVTSGVRDQSRLPAQILSASTLIDFVGSLGLFKFIFQASPLGPLPPALAFSGLLLFMGHRSGSGMVNRLKSNGMASVSIGVFMAIAGAQSLTTGVGVFLFNGQHKVVNHRAAELAAADFQRREQRITSWRDPATNTLMLADLAQCESNIRKLDQAGSNNPAYQQLSVETFGRWQDRRVSPSNEPRWVLQNWPRERWPICPRAVANKADLERRINGESRQLENLQRKLQEAPSPTTFLRQHQPQVFDEHFRVKGDGTVEMKDSLRAFGTAWNFFWFPPAEYRSDLTLSLLMMWISIGTSAAAFLLLLRYSLKDETKMSFSEPCGQHRAELLLELQQRLPDEITDHFRDLEAKERRQGLPVKEGVKLSEIDKLNPEFQTLAHLAQNGDPEVRRLARQQYYERLVDLYIQRSNVTGEIDYAYIANKVQRYWADLKVAGQARVIPHGSDRHDPTLR